MDDLKAVFSLDKCADEGHWLRMFVSSKHLLLLH